MIFLQNIHEPCLRRGLQRYPIAAAKKSLRSQNLFSQGDNDKWVHGDLFFWRTELFGA